MHACIWAACRTLKLMGFLICGIYLSACGGGSNDGGSNGEPVNVTGVWVGTYKADDGQSGTLLFDLVQDDDNLSGNAALTGVGIPYGRTWSSLNGTLVGLAASFGFRIGPEHFATAQAITNVTSNQLSGTVPLESGATANFTASKLPTRYVTAKQDVLLTNESDELPLFLTAWKGGLWIYEHGWSPWSEILAYDGSGNLIDGISAAPDCSGGFVRCGDGFFCSDHSGSLQQIRSSGKTWTSSAMPTGSIAMFAEACDGTTLWGLRTDKPVASGYTLLQQSALDGTALGEGVQVQMPLMLSHLAFDDRGLLGIVSGLPMLVRIDSQTGKLLAAYKFADPGTMNNLSGLAWDGASLWTVNRFVSNAPPAPYPIYGQRLVSFSL